MTEGLYTHILDKLANYGETLSNKYLKQTIQGPSDKKGLYILKVVIKKKKFNTELKWPILFYTISSFNKFRVFYKPEYSTSSRIQGNDETQI